MNKIQFIHTRLKKRNSLQQNRNEIRPLLVTSFYKTSECTLFVDISSFFIWYCKHSAIAASTMKWLSPGSRAFLHMVVYFVVLLCFSGASVQVVVSRIGDGAGGRTVVGMVVETPGLWGGRVLSAEVVIIGVEMYGGISRPSIGPFWGKICLIILLPFLARWFGAIRGRIVPLEILGET